MPLQGTGGGFAVQFSAARHDQKAYEQNANTGEWLGITSNAHGAVHREVLGLTIILRPTCALLAAYVTQEFKVPPLTPSSMPSRVMLALDSPMSREFEAAILCTCGGHG